MVLGLVRPFGEGVVARDADVCLLRHRTDVDAYLSARRQEAEQIRQQAARQQGLEGVMAKRAQSRYEPGRRSREWLKVKPGKQRQEFVIAGYTKGQGRRAGRLGALILAVNRGGELHYVGNCGTGFTETEIEKLLKALRK